MTIISIAKVAKVANQYSYVKIVVRNIKITLDYGDIKKNAILFVMNNNLITTPMNLLIKN
jgi:hypothetical protein